MGDSWKMRNVPLPDIYGGMPPAESNFPAQPIARRKTPSLEANPYEGALGVADVSLAAASIQLKGGMD